MAQSRIRGWFMSVPSEPRVSICGSDKVDLTDCQLRELTSVHNITTPAWPNGTEGAKPTGPCLNILTVATDHKHSHRAQGATFPAAT
eukprot:6021620-Amphidinium_carterae.1